MRGGDGEWCRLPPSQTKYNKKYILLRKNYKEYHPSGDPSNGALFSLAMSVFIETWKYLLDFRFSLVKIGN